LKSERYDKNETRKNYTRRHSVNVEREKGREGGKEGRNGYVLTRFFLESRGVSIRSTSSQTSLQ
jgi:hypothetical protein